MEAKQQTRELHCLSGVFFNMFLSVVLGRGHFCLGVFLAIFSHLREVSVVVTGTGNLCNNRKIKLCIRLPFPFEDNYYLDKMYSIYTYWHICKHFSIKGHNYISSANNILLFNLAFGTVFVASLCKMGLSVC